MRPAPDPRVDSFPISWAARRCPKREREKEKQLSKSIFVSIVSGTHLQHHVGDVMIADA